jgi:hypothetical protein
MDLKILFLFLLNFIFVYNEEEFILDETIFYNFKNAINIRTPQEILKLFNTTDITYFAYYYSKQSQNSKVGAFYLRRLDPKLDYLAKILLIDCDSLDDNVDMPGCNVKNKPNDYPIIKLLVPPTNKFDKITGMTNSHREINWTSKSVSEKDIYDFIADNTATFSGQLDNSRIDPFVNTQLFNKIILFTEKESTPVSYKGLSNIFFDRILFGEVNKKHKKLMDKYNINKLPQIIAIENNIILNGDPIIHYHEGSNNPEELYKFIEKFALKEKYYLRKFYLDSLLDIQVKNINQFNYEEFLLNQTSIDGNFIFFVNNANRLPEDIIKFVKITK